MASRTIAYLKSCKQLIKRMTWGLPHQCSKLKKEGPLFCANCGLTKTTEGAVAVLWDCCVIIGIVWNYWKLFFYCLCDIYSAQYFQCLGSCRSMESCRTLHVHEYQYFLKEDHIILLVCPAEKSCVSGIFRYIRVWECIIMCVLLIKQSINPRLFSARGERELKAEIRAAQRLLLEADITKIQILW